MKTNLKLKYCVLLNFILFIFVLSVVLLFKDEEHSYMKYGPNDNLYVLSIKINTTKKYMYLQLFLMIVEASTVFMNEIAGPILGFSIYNPDKKIITEFTKNELQILANLMWLINNLLRGLFVMITISQIDIAILKILYSEATSIFTIRLLLNDKKFISEKSNKNDDNDDGEKDNEQIELEHLNP